MLKLDHRWNRTQNSREVSEDLTPVECLRRMLDQVCYLILIKYAHVRFSEWLTWRLQRLTMHCGACSKQKLEPDTPAITSIWPDRQLQAGIHTAALSISAAFPRTVWKWLKNTLRFLLVSLTRTRSFGLTLSLSQTRLLCTLEWDKPVWEILGLERSWMFFVARWGSSFAHMCTSRPFEGSLIHSEVVSFFGLVKRCFAILLWLLNQGAKEERWMIFPEAQGLAQYFHRLKFPKLNRLCRYFFLISHQQPLPLNLRGKFQIQTLPPPED